MTDVGVGEAKGPAKAATPNTSQEYLWAYNMVERRKLIARELKDNSETFDLDKLVEFASNLRSGMGCRVTDQLTSGASSIVRVLAFDDGVRWVAKIAYYRAENEQQQQSEIDTLRLLKERGLPVPEVYGYDLTATVAGAMFVLMELLPGNAIQDVKEVTKLNSKLFPSAEPLINNWPDNFFRTLAEFQVRLANVRMKATGHAQRDADGEITYSPPCGRFNACHISTRSYLEDWAAHGIDATLGQIRMGRQMGTTVSESAENMRRVPPTIKQIAATFDEDGEDEVGFPMTHLDLDTQAILVDDDLNVTGVVSWHHAAGLPWFCQEFPYYVARVSPETPGYESNGNEQWRRYYEDHMRARERYIQYLKDAEQKTGSDNRLSTAIASVKFTLLRDVIEMFEDIHGPEVDELRDAFSLPKQIGDEIPPISP